MSLKYRISNVGWYNFELLVQSLLKVIIGPGVTSFGGSKDQGRDAQFAGPANCASLPWSFDPPNDVTPGPMITFRSDCTSSSKLYQPTFEIRYLRLISQPAPESTAYIQSPRVCEHADSSARVEVHI